MQLSTYVQASLAGQFSVLFMYPNETMALNFQYSLSQILLCGYMLLTLSEESMI